MKWVKEFMSRGKNKPTLADFPTNKKPESNVKTKPSISAPIIPQKSTEDLVFELSLRAPASTRDTNAPNSIKELINFGLSVPLSDRVEYFKGIANQLSSFSSSDIMSAVERLRAPFHPYRLIVLLAALQHNLIETNHQYYAWYLLASDFAMLDMERETLACAFRALTFNYSSTAAAWEYIDDDHDIPWKEHPNVRAGIRSFVVPYIRVPDRWKQLDPSAQRERLISIADELSSYIPFSLDEVGNLVAKLVQIPEGMFGGWECAAKNIEGYSTVDDKVLLLADNALLCLSLDEGQFLWKSLENEMGYPNIKDVLTNGNRVFVKGKRGVYCLTADTGETLWMIPCPARTIYLWGEYVIVVSSNKISKLNRDKGTVEWEAAVPEVDWSTLLSDRLFYTSKTDDSLSGGERLLGCINLVADKEVWKEKFRGISSYYRGMGNSQFQVVGEVVLVNCGNPGNELVALDLVTGNKKWCLKYEEGGSASFVGVCDKIVIVEPQLNITRGNVVQALSLETGSLLWSKRKLSCEAKNVTKWNCSVKNEGNIVCIPKIVVDIYSSTFYLAAFQCLNGKETFYQKVIGDNVEILANTRDKIVLRTDLAIIAFDVNSGDFLWDSPLADSRVSYLPSDNRLWVSCWESRKRMEKQNLTCFDLNTGTVLRTIQAPKSNYAVPDPLFISESVFISWWDDRVKLLRT